MDKISISQAVIVEGKYDKIKLSSILDAVIIATDGFRIYKDKETADLIRKYAFTTGIVILTDYDSVQREISQTYSFLMFTEKKSGRSNLLKKGNSESKG